ncbi:quinolinate synthase NadA [Parvularcula maris]|uniref:Quinolinate synthase n=1 Tax=Parvularcula maris TaxID=2965077 RepID=A0A9X2L8X8_9PROT|nr:quinolinate synthase NadA [Parvularcula maris]MCQ8185299.1 quinolinate synthase NadA [Parvularcula maris]
MAAFDHEQSHLSPVAVSAATDHLYPLVSAKVPEFEWKVMAPVVARILQLKEERDAVILAHNYMTPEIFAVVGDIRGDSLQLAREAAKVKQNVIVQGGVHFMAETSKVLAPAKKVLIPSLEAGCSLASSITGSDVRLLKERYPGVPVVTYVNTTAEVKAETDICCTSSNAVQVVEHICAEFGTNQVILIPDQYLAKNVARMTDKKVITWAGSCEVHERFSAEDIREIRAGNPGVVVLAHPECPPEVLAEADYAGSTAAMSGYVQKKQPRQVVLVTECSMSDNVALENPGVEFVRPCNLCPHMKRITLEGIQMSLETMTHEVHVDEAVAERARVAVQRMIDLPPPASPAAFTVGHGGDVVAVEHR